MFFLKVLVFYFYFTKGSFVIIFSNLWGILSQLKVLENIVNWVVVRREYVVFQTLF
jgi:hypothetical protein